MTAQTFMTGLGALLAAMVILGIVIHVTDSGRN